MPRIDKETVIALSLAGALFCGMAAYIVPNFLSMTTRAHRAEVPGNVDGITTAERAYEAAFDEYVAAGSREEAMAALREGRSPKGKAMPRKWEGGAAWEKLGWTPDGMVRSAYWIEVPPEGGAFTVYGIIDVDGDGEIAEYRASSAEPQAKLVTPHDVY